MSLMIQICKTCGQGHYPETLLCCRCGGADFTHEPAGTATVIARTDVVYQVGGDSTEPVRLALVETQQGVKIIARLTGASQVSDDVAFAFDGPMLLARPSAVRGNDEK